MEYSAGFKIYADASQFQREMKASVESAKQVQRGLKDIGLNIGGFLGVGAIVRAFGSVMDSARQLRDETIRTGSALDDNVRRVADLGDAFDTAKKNVVGFGITALSWVTKAGEGWGMLINRIRGVSAEQERLGEAAAAGAEDTAKRIAAAQAANSPEKLAKADSNLAAARRQNALDVMTVEQRYQALLEEHVAASKELKGIGKNTVAYREKALEVEQMSAGVRKAAADVAKQDAEEFKKIGQEDLEWYKKKFSLEEKLHEQKIATASAAEKVTLLEKDAADFKGKQSKFDKDSVEYLELQVKLNDTNVSLSEARKNLAEQTAAAEAAIAASMTKQNTALNGIAGIRGAKQFSEASPEALKEQIRRNEAAIRGIGTPAIGPLGNLGDANELARLQIEIQNLKRELDFRSGLQTDISRLGIQGARQNFQGDPLQFDRLVQQYVNDARNNQQLASENNRLLTDIRDRFKSGVAVVQLNK